VPGLLSVRAWPDSVLKCATAEVTVFDGALAALLEAMGTIMYELGGVGLAANQVGVSRRLFVYDYGDGNLRPVINPVVLAGSGSQEGEEGCLSLVGGWWNIDRYESIRYRAQDIDGTVLIGEVEGFEARIFQHEIDHLDGLLLLDHLSVEDRKIARMMLVKQDD
jgi:peptide deformylase